MVMSTCEVDPFQTDAWRVAEPRQARESVDLNVLNSLADTEFDNDGDLLVELIDLYLVEGQRQLDVIETALETKDRDAIKRACHSLRGSSGNLGILQMALICNEMEKQEYDDPFPFLEALKVSLDREFRHVRGILTTERERRTP